MPSQQAGFEVMLLILYQNSTLPLLKTCVHTLITKKMINYLGSLISSLRMGLILQISYTKMIPVNLDFLTEVSWAIHERQSCLLHINISTLSKPSIQL